MNAGDWRLAAVVGAIFAVALIICFFKWYTENYLPRKRKRKEQAATPAPLPSGHDMSRAGVASDRELLPPAPLPTASLYGTEYWVASDLEEMRRVLDARKPLMFRFKVATYMATMRELMQFMESRFGKNSSEQQAVLASPLVCPGCNTLFPDSWKVHASLGGGNASCPACKNQEALLVLQVNRPEDITEDDVEALRRYWRSQAVKWWKSKNYPECQCSYSMACDYVKSGDGYFLSGRIYCNKCAEDKLRSALRALRNNPSYFGMDELRLARNFMAQQQSDRNQVAAPPPAAAAWITYPCPHCAKKLRSKPEMSGKRVKCPGCNQTIPVPAAS
jgi:hypothetical protein